MKYKVLKSVGRPGAAYTVSCRWHCQEMGWKYEHTPREYPIVDLDESDALIHALSQSEYYLQKVEE